MPPVPRAPGSVPPCAGSSTTMFSPPCWVCVPNGEAADPATLPGVGVAAGLVAAGALAAGCCACDGVSDGETSTPARRATDNSPIKEREFIRRILLTYNSIPNPSLSRVRRRNNQRLQFSSFEQCIHARYIALLECSPTRQRLLRRLFPPYAGDRGIGRGPQFGAVHDDQK